MKKKEILVLEDFLGSKKKIATDIRTKLTQRGILTKADLLPIMPFDSERARKEALEINPNLKVFVTSALKDSGIQELVDFFIATRKNLLCPHA